MLLPALSCAQDFVVDRVRVFDGERTIEHASVVVQAGYAPTGLQVINGSGRTLLPGLIDAHTHIQSHLDLQKSPAFGVTTDLSLQMPPQLARELKSEPDGHTPSEQAELFSAGFAATAPHGHGTEYGFPVPTLTNPTQAQAWVDGRIAEGSELIKIMYEFGGENGRISRPGIDKATLVALVAAAHNRGKLAVVHVHTDKQAFDAIDSGADGLAHLFLFGGDTVDPRFARQLLGHHMCVIPTLTVLHSACGLSPGQDIIDDLRLGKYLLPEDVTLLQRNIAKASPADCARSTRATAELAGRGVPILAGSDQPNPGTAPGASIHGELALLVEAGLTPVQAPRATSATARAFRLADRGRIAPGMRADLVLVDGDPTVDIRATRNIVSVWKAGVQFDRDAWRERMRAEVR